MKKHFSKAGSVLAVAVVLVLSVVFLMSAGSCGRKQAQGVERHVENVPDGKVVTTIPGDTLSFLCDYYMGSSNPEVCRFIADLNGRGINEVLKPGEKLFFPSLSVMLPPAQEEDLTEVKNVAREVKVSDKNETWNEIWVTVKPGDTLSRICDFYLGGGGPDVYEVIAFENNLKNSGQIFPDQVINITKVHRAVWTDREGKTRHSVWNFMGKKGTLDLINILRRDDPSLRDFFIEFPTADGLRREAVK